ncbi:phage tail protein I, partial [Ursidibacter maritimus]
LKEWWQESPPATAGTFKLTVEVSETGLNQQTNEELIRFIENVIPVSRHFTLAIAITPVGEMNVFMASQMGEIITVYP